MPGYLLAIDAGTGSGRAVLFNTSGEQVVAVGEEWSHSSDPRFPGSMGFECEQNWTLLSRCVKACLEQARINASDVLGVSATSMREGIVLLDAHGHELWACANVDARATDQVRELSRNHPNLEREAYRRSGQTFALAALPRLLWVQRNLPEVYEQTRSVMMLSDWVLYRLCGEIAADPSNASTSGIFDNATRTWAPDLAKQLGLKDDIFPRVLEPGTLMGQVHAQAARDTGLNVGTGVVMGGGDAQLGCVGLGVVQPGQAAVLGGSFWQQEVNLPAAASDPSMNVRVNCHAVPGLWQAEAIVFYAGLTMRWFRDAFCQPEKELAAAKGVDTYSVLEEMAATVPVGSHGIMPVFSDVMRYSSWYHASPSLLNLNLDPTRCGKPEIFRALQENAAIVTAGNLEQIYRFSGVNPESLVFAGGAAKGALWCQILADATGKPLRIPVVKEATALGTALAAGVGARVYQHMLEAAQVVKFEREVQPILENVQIYRELRERWTQAYAAQRQLVDAHITTSLWKAPGL
jgi:autoinducer-2 kinase